MTNFKFDTQNSKPSFQGSKSAVDFLEVGSAAVEVFGEAIKTVADITEDLAKDLEANKDE